MNKKKKKYTYQPEIIRLRCSEHGAGPAFHTISFHISQFKMFCTEFLVDFLHCYFVGLSYQIYLLFYTVSEVDKNVSENETTSYFSSRNNIRGF